jgi:hypothetical protein
VNDDMKEAPPIVRDALRDFYLSFFALPCPMELPPGRANPFLRVGPLMAFLAAEKEARLMRGAALCAGVIGSLVLLAAWIAERTEEGPSAGARSVTAAAGAPLLGAGVALAAESSAPQGAAPVEDDKAKTQ